MKKVVHLLFVLSVQAGLSLMLHAQAIPVDSLYLGQTPPGYTPGIFQLPVSSGLFAAERIAVSPDGREIFYGDLNGYPPSVSRIKYFKYSDNRWNGPFVLFQGYIAPTLSPGGDTLYFQDNQPNAWYSVRTDTTWGTPRRFWSGAHQQHYVQATSAGRYYLTSDPVVSSLGDLSVLRILNADTTVQSLGVPLNSSNNGLDFFIARDESFLLRVIRIGGRGDLYISYHRPDGGWTNPKNLGSQVNSPQGWEWGPYVTADNRYLFFTRQITSVVLYWVRVDNLIDSLRHTNYLPYVKSQIPNRTDTVGRSFTYQFPESTFIDDDGNTTLAYSATLSNGNPLPAWLSFNPAARTFAGTPSAVAAIHIRVTATDTAGASASCTFDINVIDATGTGETGDRLPQGIDLYQNYPNPFNPTTRIAYRLSAGGRVRLTVHNLLGQKIRTLQDGFQNAGEHSLEWDATDDRSSRIPSGMYFLRLDANERTAQRKMMLLR